ncbi:MAG: NAD-dependent epimerase/dehydratase family protein [Bacteroidales bacterium]|nr:NAD-dependent epimerase/dehydratase family protein [Bacteroidales bacterium]
MSRILVTGAGGQIGSELTCALRAIYGNDNVIATDLSENARAKIAADGPFELLDVMQKNNVEAMIKKHGIDGIFHLAAILSAVGEQKPNLAWNINIQGAMNVFDAARDNGVKRIFAPSSMAVFGPTTPFDNTPQDTILQPTTIYGMTKVIDELIGKYYIQRYGMDIRGVRYPGIISNATLPGGGTTDYAVQIYYDAVKYGKYECFLKEDTMLPMMYMPDCLKGTLDLFHAKRERLIHNTDFNLAAFSVTPKDIYMSIKKYMPDFEITYKPDFRQAIADSWPNSIDDSSARAEWDWKPSFDLDAMTLDMLKVIGERYKRGLIVNC